MKCFCCDKELNSDKFAWCPDCGLVIDIAKKQATVRSEGDKSYIQESLECMRAISKYRPDVVLSKWQLFSVGFKCADVKFLYKNRNSADCCVNPKHYITKENIVRGNYKDYIEEYPVLVAIQGVLSYEFKKITALNYHLAESWKGTPVLSLFNISAYQYLYQIAGVLALDLDIKGSYADKFVNTMTRWRVDAYTMQDDCAALLAFFTNSIKEVVKDHLFSIEDKLDLEDVMRRIMRNSPIKPKEVPCANKGIQSLHEVYSRTRPCLCGTLYDPLRGRFDVEIPKDNSLLFTWWIFMGKLCSKYLPVVTLTPEELFVAYVDFINS